MAMKGKNFREVQDEYRETVVGLCVVCQKPTQGWYGRWGNLGTCSKKCELIQEAIPKYPRQGEGNAVISQGSDQEVGE